MKESARDVLILLLATAALFLTTWAAQADDSAASIAAGGLVPRRETRIVMAKEVLRISNKKVAVDYYFRNDSAQDVITEVAFPVPPYKDDTDAPTASLQPFSDFRLFVDEKPAAFQAEARATLNGKDVTGTLIANKVDIASFGHYEDSSGSDSLPRIRDFARLSKAHQKRLSALGLFDSDPPMANWTVHLQYHWTQTFPAHSTVHIRHEYTPVVGFSYMTAEALELALNPGVAKEENQSRWKDSGADVVTGFCPKPQLLRGLIHRLKETQMPEERGIFYPRWVDFILTTANSWQRPIEDFTLIVERPQTSDGEQSFVSFCSPGPVEKLDANHFRVHLTNFVPSAELHIGFFTLPDEPSRPVARK